MVIQIGDRFDRLLVVDRAPNTKQGDRQWHCVCVCGTRRIVKTGNLRSGHSRSCGCASADHAAAAHFKHGHARHHRVSREFNAWTSMLDRCRNPKARAYADYGGRGIQVCAQWRNSFSAFFADVGQRPSARHSLDRIDNNGNYEPGNVRWALKNTQQRNQRSNRQITYQGRTQPLAAWTEELRLPYRTVYMRLRRGATVEDAFSHR